MTRLSDESNNVPGRLRTHGVQVGTPEFGGSTWVLPTRICPA